MKTWIASWKPYFSLYRLKAMQETQYRAAALGGLVTQAFFGLLYVFLYTALFRGENHSSWPRTGFTARARSTALPTEDNRWRFARRDAARRSCRKRYRTSGL